MRRCLAIASAALAVLLLAAACGGSGPRLPAAAAADLLPSARDLRGVLEDMAEDDSVYVRRLRRAGLTPAFEGRFRLASGPVVAFIPGRHPGRSDELVVAVAPMGTPAAAALLEEARLLNARAAYAVTPERSVLVGFLPRRTGARGLAAVLDAPVWTRPLMVAALVVGAGEAGASYEAEGAVRGVPVEVVVAPTAGEGPVEEALALGSPLRTALTALAHRAPAAPEVGVPPDTVRGRPLPFGG